MRHPRYAILPEASLSYFSEVPEAMPEAWQGWLTYRPPQPFAVSFERQLKHFLDCLGTGQAPRTTAIDQGLICPVRARIPSEIGDLQNATGSVGLWNIKVLSSSHGVTASTAAWGTQLRDMRCQGRSYQIALCSTRFQGPPYHTGEYNFDGRICLLQVSHRSRHLGQHPETPFSGDATSSASRQPHTLH
jgi:hypothetical protein